MPTIVAIPVPEIPDMAELEGDGLMGGLSGLASSAWLAPGCGAAIGSGVPMSMGGGGCRQGQLREGAVPLASRQLQLKAGLAGAAWSWCPSAGRQVGRVLPILLTGRGTQAAPSLAALSLCALVACNRNCTRALIVRALPGRAEASKPGSADQPSSQCCRRAALSGC